MPIVRLVRPISVFAMLLCSGTAVAAPNSSHLAIGLSGSYRNVASERTEWRGVIELTVPLDRFVAPAAVAEQPGDDDGVREWEEQAEGTLDGQDADQPGPTAPDSAPASPTHPERDRPFAVPGASGAPLAIDSAFARRLVQAALRAGGFSSTRRRLDSLAARARTSAALPELRLRGGRSTDASLRLMPTLSDPDRYTATGGSDLWMEARLTWKLDRLVFNSAELSVERLRGRNAKARLNLVRRVLEALFAWRKATIRALEPELLPDERLEAMLVSLEAEATLDVLTDGWFSEQLGETR